MPCAIPLRRDFDGSDLRRLARRCRDTRQTLRDWVHRIGFGPRPGCLGEPARLQWADLDQRKFLAKIGLKGAVTGVINRSGA